VEEEVEEVTEDEDEYFATPRLYCAALVGDRILLG
jgi:hypothetical protein